MKRQPRTLPTRRVRGPLLRKEKLPEMPSHRNTHISGNGYCLVMDDDDDRIEDPAVVLITDDNLTRAAKHFGLNAVDLHLHPDPCTPSV